MQWNKIIWHGMDLDEVEYLLTRLLEYRTNIIWDHRSHTPFNYTSFIQLHSHTMHCIDLLVHTVHRSTLSVNQISLTLIILIIFIITKSIILGLIWRVYLSSSATSCDLFVPLSASLLRRPHHRLPPTFLQYNTMQYIM